MTVFAVLGAWIACLELQVVAIPGLQLGPILGDHAHSVIEVMAGLLCLGGAWHARRERGSGYCTFNGLVLAAQAALAAGAGDVLILDLDAHCGGGTHALIAENPHIWQVDVSVDAFDRYEPGERTTLDIVASAADYLPTIAQRLHDVQAQRFGLYIYNAGMDPHEDCPDGALAGIRDEHLRGREELHAPGNDLHVAAPFALVSHERLRR